MAKNKLADVRNHLFETLERLTDRDDPMDTKRAVAISQVANAIINSAKLELRAIDILGQGIIPNSFLGIEEGPKEKKPALLAVNQKKA
jgi:hypothetical protein